MSNAFCNKHYLLFFLFFALCCFSAKAEEKCSVFSQKSIANAFVTPFGLVSSDTGNVQYFGVLNCGAYGGYVNHVQRFNGGRDNTITGAWYLFKATQNLKIRVALDNLDVNQPSFEVSRLRLKLIYHGELNYSAEYFNFFNGKDQKVLMWSAGDSYTVNSDDTVSWKIGGSFHSGFGLQDRYYVETAYRSKLQDNWFWQVRYQYQHQPEQVNIGMLDIIYNF